MANEVGKAYVSILPSMRGFSSNIRAQLKKELAGVDANIKGSVKFDAKQAVSEATAAVKAAQTSVPDVKNVGVKFNKDGAVREVKLAVAAAQKAAPKVEVKTEVDARQVARNAAAGILAARGSMPDLTGVQVKLDRDGLIREVRTAVKAAEKAAPKVEIKTEVDKDIGAFLKNIGGNPLRALGNIAEDLVGIFSKGLTPALGGTASGFAQITATAISLIAVTGALISVFLALAVVIGGVLAVAIGSVIAGIAAAAVAFGSVLPAAILGAVPAVAALMYIFDGFGKLLSAITEGDLKKFDKFLDTLTGKSKVFAEAFRPLVELKDEVQGEFFGAILDGFDNQLPAAISKFKSLVLDTTKLFGDFAKNIIQDFSTVENRARFDRIFSSGKIALDGLLDGIRPLAQAFLTVADAGSHGFAKLGQSAGRVLTVVAAALTKLADDGTIERILDSFSQLVDVAGAELVGVFTDFATLAPTFLNVFREMLPAIRPFIDAISQFLVAAGPGFVAFMQGLAELFADPAFVQSMVDLGVALGMFLEALVPLMPYLPVLLAFFTGLVFAATLALGALTAFLDIVFALTDAIMGLSFGDAISQFNLLRVAMNAAKAVMATLGGAAVSAASAVVAAFRGVSAVEGIFKNAMNLAKSAIRNASGFLHDAALSVTEDMLAGFRTAYQKVGGIGRAIVQGMASGVRAAAGALADAAVSVVKGALNRAKAAAGISSPATVWRDEVGKQLGFGTAEGIRLSTFDVVNASQQLMLDALRASQNASNGFPAGLRIGTALLDSDVPPGSDDDDNPQRPIVLEADGVEIARVVDRGNAKRARR